MLDDEKENVTVEVKESFFDEWHRAQYEICYNFLSYIFDILSSYNTEDEKE